MTQQVTQQSSTQETDEAGAGVAIGEVRFEHRQDTLGTGTAQPRLSWLVDTGRPGWLQAAYEVEAVGPDGQARGQTGRVDSPESMLVAWPFAPLASRERA